MTRDTGDGPEQGANHYHCLAAMTEQSVLYPPGEFGRGPSR
jgi:hypothetical protein